MPTDNSTSLDQAANVIDDIILKGDYDASTNSPDLDTSPVDIEKGDHYVVNVAGTFFTISLEIGDSVIAKINDAAIEGDWIILQANLTSASIKTQYESNADTNEYSDAEQTKLAGVESGASGDLTGSEIKALYEAVTNAYTDTKDTKLSGIETAATADQTNAEIKTAYEANTNTNEFSDAEQTKVANTSGTNTGDEAAASTTLAGIAEIATSTEINTGTDDVRTVSPLGLAGSQIQTDVTANNDKVTNATHTGEVTGSTSLTIATDSVSNLKASNMAQNTIKGRITVSTGDPEDLTAANVLSIIGVEAGSTADQSGAEIKTAYEAETNAYTDTKDTKLSGIATAATANSTDAVLLARANHTGTQAQSTVTNLVTNLSSKAPLASPTFTTQITSPKTIMTGRHQDKQGADIAATSILILGGDGNFFIITGTTTITQILATDWQNGVCVTLKFNGILTITNNSGGLNDILSGDGSDITTASGFILTLRFDGTDWIEQSRNSVGGGAAIMG